MTKEITHSGLGVALRKDEGAGMYEFGVVIDGEFIGFGARKTGGIDGDLARGAANKAAAAASADTVTEPNG
jgi:hypothetical protein